MEWQKLYSWQNTQEESYNERWANILEEKTSTENTTNLNKEDVVYLFENYNEIKTNIELIESALKYVTSQAYANELQYASGVKVGSGGAPTTGTVSDKTYNAVVNTDIACNREQKELQAQLTILCFIKEQIDVYIRNLKAIDRDIFTSRYINGDVGHETLSVILDNHARRLSKTKMYEVISRITNDFAMKTLIKRQDFTKLVKLLNNN